jgi:phosphoribosylglycinamide formyltransferase 1
MKAAAVALFASGNGSNALRLIDYFKKKNGPVSIVLLVCNKPDAPVVEKAREKGVEVLLVDNATVENGLTLLQELRYRSIDWIVLAGFLRKIPLNMIRGFQDRIINIHPSLLPKFGGKGMYGMFVHRAVVEAGETETGISIHLVNEEFDKGRILAQFSVQVSETDTPETVAEKVQQLEHTHFSQVVEATLLETV